MSRKNFKVRMYVFAFSFLLFANLNAVDLYVEAISIRVYSKGVDILIVDKETGKEAVYFTDYKNLTEPVDPYKFVWHQLEEPFDRAKRSFPYHKFNEDNYGIIFPYALVD